MNHSEDTPEELNMKTFEKIVLITTPEYSAYFEKFINSKVSVFCVTAGNLNNVASAVKCRRKFEPGKTLWLTHPEVIRMDRIEKSDMCMACKEPLEIHVLPSMAKMTYSNYPNVIQSSFDELIKKANSFLNAESSFAILPPFPPSFLPLEDTEHHRYHKTGKDRKTYYLTTSAALIGFESLYAELSKQMISFSLAELRKTNITRRSIADYFMVTGSWNSYLHVVMQADALQSEYTNTKYNQWFKHIKKFLSDTLKPSSAENISVKSVGEKENALKDSCGSSGSRDNASHILNEILQNVPTIDEASEPESIILDFLTASPKTEESINLENYDHIVIICFCKAHARLVIEEERTQNISVVVVKSTLNWSEESEKFDIFARIYKTVLFIVIGSINLFANEYHEVFCITQECADPLLCLDFGLDSNSLIFHKVVNKYKLFIKNLRSHFQELSTSFILTPMIPVKCTPRPDITTKSIHQDIHKLLANTNTYLTFEGSERWSSLTDNFQMYHFIQMLRAGHNSYEIEMFTNILKEIKYTSKPIFWVKLSESIITTNTDYSEDELKIFVKKLIVLCSIFNCKRNPECSDISDSSLDIKKEIMDSEISQQIAECSKATKICHLKILLESDVADEIFGDNGETLQKLQKDTNSKILISKKGEFFPRTSERVCLIAGTAEAVFNSLAFIIDIKKEMPLCGIEMQMRFVVPDTTAKLIIGDREENMRLIKIKSKVFMRMYNRSDYPASNETCFIVRSVGDDFIKTAFFLILQRIAFDPENDSYSNVTYPDVSVPAIISEKDSSSNRSEQVVDSVLSRLMQDNSKKNKIFHLKILLKSDFVKVVIGDNGETLQKLQKDTKSRVTISEELDYFPGTTERVCSIAGAANAVLKALFFIIDVKKAHTPHASEVNMEFIVPDSTAKLIIGKKEENIQQIKTSSKAYMRMYRKKDHPSPNESCFVIRSFDVEFIRTAFSLILECILLDPVNGTRSNETNPDVNFSTSSCNKSPKIKDLSVIIRNQYVELATRQLTLENSKENICHLKILLESDIANKVIGINGETLQNLQKETNSQIIISKEGEYFPGTSERVCYITGTVNEVLIALFCIIDIKLAKSVHRSVNRVKFVVPDSTARLIIGEKEENIQQIKIKSEAYIRMYKKKDYPSPNESCFVVTTFDVENVKRTFSLILDYIVLDPENGSCSSISYSRVSLASNSDKSSKIKDSSVTIRKEFAKLTAPGLTLENSKEDICHLKILLESDIANKVIGVNGAILRNLQKETNSKIIISKEGEYFPGTSERVCSTTGTVDEVLKALFCIIDIKLAKSLHGSDYRVKFVVPDRTARLIIGHNERNIYQIKTKSKAFLRMYKKKDYPSTDESCFVVNSYDVENIKRAFSLVLEYIIHDPENGSCSSISYPRVLPASNTIKTSKNKDSSIANSSSTAASKEIHNWNSRNYGHQTNESYSNYVGNNSQYNYEYHVNCEYPSSYAASAYPVPIVQNANESMQEVSEYSSLYVANGYPENSNAYPSTSVAGQEIHYWGSQIYGYQVNESYNNCASDNHYSYGYPVASGYSSSNLVAQTVNEYPSRQEDSEYLSRYVNGYPESSGQVTNPSERQRVYNHESESQIASGYPIKDNKIDSRSPSPDSRNEYHSLGNSRQRSIHGSRSPFYYKCRIRPSDRRSRSWKSRSISPEFKSLTYSSKRFCSRKSIDDRSHSHKRSRSRIKNYRKRSRSYSRSRSRSKRRSNSNFLDRESQSKYRSSSLFRSDDKPIHCDSNEIDDDFSVSGAIYLLERVCDKCGTLGGWIKTFTTSLKSEMESDRNKALRLIEDDNDILPLKMIANKLKSIIPSAPIEEIGMLTKAAEWTTYLIEYIEKPKKPERNINLKAIAEASLYKTPDFIVELIKTAFLYEGSKPTEEDINKTFVKVSELQFEIVMKNKPTE